MKSQRITHDKVISMQKIPRVLQEFATIKSQDDNRESRRLIDNPGSNSPRRFQGSPRFAIKDLLDS